MFHSQRSIQRVSVVSGGVAIATAAVALSGLAFFGGMVIASVVELKDVPTILGPLAIIEERVELLPPQSPPVVNASLSIYFENGSAKLSAEQMRQLLGLKAALSACSNTTVL